MSPFWASLFANLKDCGRNGTIFLAALAGFFGVLLVGAIVFKLVYADNLQGYLPLALTVIGMTAVLWSFRTIRQGLARSRERLAHPPLSCDELRVARSKLLKNRDSKSL